MLTFWTFLIFLGLLFCRISPRYAVQRLFPTSIPWIYTLLIVFFIVFFFDFFFKQQCDCFGNFLSFSSQLAPKFLNLCVKSPIERFVAVAIICQIFSTVCCWQRRWGSKLLLLCTLPYFTVLNVTIYKLKYVTYKLRLVDKFFLSIVIICQLLVFVFSKSYQENRIINFAF